MRRADRLFEIIQTLRRASGPLTAEAIAAAVETSRWTIYRDIAALVAQRVPIRSEAGIGYVLERGFDLPPLMLTTSEVEAVTLGSQWVIANAEPELARAALDVLAKIAAIVPEDLRAMIDNPVTGTLPPVQDGARPDIDIARLRLWSRTGRMLSILYVDEAGAETQRTIWPFMVGYVATVRVVVAWCELRSDFRIFRTDRIAEIAFQDRCYPARSATLRRRWLKAKEDANRTRAGVT